MLCPNCGTVLEDDVTECQYCGCQLAESHSLVHIVQGKDTRGNTRGDILDDLRSALSVIRQLEAIEEKKIEFSQRREDIEQKRQEILDDDMPGALAVLYLLAIIVAGGFGASAEGMIGMIVAVIMALIALGLIYSAYSALTKDSRMAKANAYYSSQIGSLEKAEKAHNQKVKAFYNKTDVAGMLDFLPEKYRSSGTISCLIKLFSERRADTLKEAINLYEDEEHKERVEEMQKAQLQEQESRMQCPNCGGRNCTLMTETTTKKDGYSAADGCCGLVLFGPLGLLCGACGSGEETKTKTYWVCQNCGNKFNA